MSGYYDIRRQRDGSIDMDYYRDKAAAYQTRAMREAAAPRALLGIALIAVVMFSFAAIAAFAPPQNIPALQQQANDLRARIDVLSASDPQHWWRHYGRGTALSQQSAIAQLQRHLAEKEAAIAAANRRAIARRGNAVPEHAAN